MIIGNLTYDREKDTYQGGLRTLTMQVEFTVYPAKKTSPEQPDYRIAAELPNSVSPLGAAWKRKSDEGKPFLSVVLDDPSFAAPINAAIFEQSGDDAVMIWTRENKKDENKKKK